jgi:hypothetical protein
VVVVSAASRTARCAVAGLALGVLTLGCGVEDPSTDASSPASGPTQTSTGSPGSETTPTEPTSTEPASTEPASTEPVVTPATGLLLEEETSRLNAPAPAGDWKRIPDIVTYASAVGHVPTTEVISLSDRENFSSPASLDEQVKFHKRTLPEGAVVERQPDVLLDGEPAYYVQWYEKGDTKIQHDIGLDHEGRVIAIQMDLDRADPAATEALVASVLASFAWR